jgi:hypothetical protein
VGAGQGFKKLGLLLAFEALHTTPGLSSTEHNAQYTHDDGPVGLASCESLLRISPSAASRCMHIVAVHLACKWGALPPCPFVGCPVPCCFQAMVFAVTMNSKRNALLALMIATNFVELKGQVYKRTDTNKLWALACQVGDSTQIRVSVMLLHLATRGSVARLCVTAGALHSSRCGRASLPHCDETAWYSACLAVLLSLECLAAGGPPGGAAAWLSADTTG